ncbi:MAG: hypothetical protein IBX61_08955 [Thermoleophilia bacterium]|nr:hypothetical protein [Thermoleophilia bacterium]
MKKKRKAFFAGAILAVAIGLSIALGANAFAAVPPKTYYFTWYDSLPENGVSSAYIVIGNLEDHEATAQVFFGKETQPRGTYSIPKGGRQTLTWPNTIGGPVKVVSPDGDTLVVTQRVIYGDSFSEAAAVEETNIAGIGEDGAASYYFTWYDSLPANGMKGNWILIANVDQTSASVAVYVGTSKMDTFAIDPGEQITPQYTNTMGGPVRVISENGQNLVVSQRVLYKNSFSEVTAVPEEKLDTIYYFTWYDMIRASGMKGNWVLISNINDTPVQAEVYIGPNGPASYRGTYTIQPNQSATPFYPELMNGPVSVVCTSCSSGQKLMVSQRVLFKDSFEEVQGTPPAGLSDELYFGWYDAKKANSMNGNWILAANQGLGSDTVDMYLGSAAGPIGTYQIAPGGRVTPQYHEMTDGPVRVASRGGQPLMVSQRVLYKDSFNELLGLTREDVGAALPLEPTMTLFQERAYWESYADYEDGRLSVDLRVRNAGQGTAVDAQITGLSASSGVTALTAIPVSLGDISGGSHKTFTLQFAVPENVSIFRVDIQAWCQDTGGSWYYYPKT